MKALVLASAIVGLAIGTASAAPMTLSGDRLDAVTAAGGSGHGPPPLSVDVYKNVGIRLYKDINIRNNMYSAPYVKGNYADSEAAANAYGHNTYSETLTVGEVVKGLYSRSFSQSVAATNGYDFHQ